MGFIAATVAAPFVVGLLAGAEDFPSSALDPRTFLMGGLVGTVATAGLAWALDGTVRRTLMAVQGASSLVDAGEHPRVIHHCLGHATARLSMERYAHVPETTDRDVASHLDARFSGGRKGRAQPGSEPARTGE